MIDADFIYELFSDIYYTKEFPQYTDQECSVTEAVQCLLKSLLFRKVKRVLLNPKIVILSFGNLVHEALRLPLTKRGFTSEQESSIPITKYTLYSHTDFIKQRLGLEFKTITRMPHEILTHHFLQGNAYYHINDLNEFYVPYIHKPSGVVKVFPLVPHKESFDYVTRRAIRLCYCLERNIMPNPEPSWLCQYCEYVNECPNPQKTVRGGFY